MRFRPMHLVLVLTVLAFGVASHARAMTFETISGPQACAERACVLASGQIDGRTADDFETFVKANKIARGALVVLNSGGGDLMQSLELGNEIRSDGFATTVASFDRKAGRFQSGGACASACAYAFLGGVERSVGDGARIGVHQIFTAGSDWQMSAADGMELMSLVATHVNRLCGHLDLMIPALKTRPQDMHWLSPGELTRYAVVTTVATQS